MSTKVTFIYFGYDFMLGTIHRLLRDGHTLAGIFTFPCDNIFNFNVETQHLAAKLKIPITESPVTSADIETFIAQGTNSFLAAGYPYKIPPIDETKAYGVNVHPSLLPAGRGLMPSPTIIMHKPNAAGFTAHKLSPTFDEGDVLDQMAIPLSSNETIESYSSRIALAAPDLLSRVFTDLNDYWRLAKPQDPAKASTFPNPTDDMRTIDWTSPIEKIDAQARAFGRYGTLALIDKTPYVIYDHDIWLENHTHTPGKLVINHEKQKTIAAQNGYFNAKDFQKLA